MGRSNQTVRPYPILRVIIDLTSLSLYVSLIDKCWAHLLVTIANILLLIGSHGVHLLSKGSCNLQFIVDKEVNIFLYGLLVDNALCIVLVV